MLDAYEAMQYAEDYPTPDPEDERGLIGHSGDAPRSLWDDEVAERTRAQPADHWFIGRGQPNPKARSVEAFKMAPGVAHEKLSVKQAKQEMRLRSLPRGRCAPDSMYCPHAPACAKR